MTANGLFSTSILNLIVDKSINKIPEALGLPALNPCRRLIAQFIWHILET